MEFLRSSRDIAGQNLYSSIGKVDCVYASAAVQLENALARVESALQIAPYGISAGLADQGVSKIAIVLGGGIIPVGSTCW